MSQKPNPLDIPEIVRMVGRFVEKSSQMAAMRVSETFHSQVSATTWETIVVVIQNKALFRNVRNKRDAFGGVSYTDAFDGVDRGGPILLPWKSLKSYGSHVRTITMESDWYWPPPSSYPRPASVTDLLKTLGELPSLKCMTLNISGVDTTDLHHLFDICSRLKSLKIHKCRLSDQGITESERQKFIDMSNRNWKAQASAHDHEPTYHLEELSMSSSCGIGLQGFISRSPRLRVLSIFHGYGHNMDEEEEWFLNDLIESFSTKDSMPSLQHLDVSIFRLSSDAISKVLRSVRCLRSFQCHHRKAVYSIHDFRRHFSTITTIYVRSGTPEFWQKVMSSCPALVKAKDVVLFAEDIIGDETWASTGLESLDLNVFVRSFGTERSRSDENALFRRIAKLVKLNHLSVHTGWDGHGDRTLRDENWEALLRIKTLTSVELGYELTAEEDMESVLSRFLERQMDNLTWTEAKMRLSSPPEHAENEGQESDALMLQALALLHN